MGYMVVITSYSIHYTKLYDERHHHLADRLGADHRGEAVLAELVLGAEILLLTEKLTLLQRREAGLDHHVVLEIEDPLQSYNFV